MKWKRQDKTKWHDWFAWYPVKVECDEEEYTHKVLWLETVQRKITKRSIRCAYNDYLDSLRADPLEPVSIVTKIVEYREKGNNK